MGDEQRAPSDGERIAVLSEQVKGMRNDFNTFRDEMKETMGTFIHHLTTMQKEYISRPEFDREMAHRDEKEKDRVTRVDEIETEIEGLRRRPTWTVASVFTGAVAIITVLIMVLVPYITHK